MRKLASVLLVLVATGCASAPIKKSDQASLAVAQTRLLDGCYQCLLEARDVFERVAVGKARPLVLARLFETYVLIGLRERELALDSSEAFAKARAIAPELPATYAAMQYVEIAALIPPDFAGSPRTELTPFQRGVPTPARFKELYAGLTTGEASPHLRDYLTLSLDCLAEFGSRRDPRPTARQIPPGLPPLVKYRYATCPVLRSAPLEELLTEVPDFVEAGLFLARQPTLNITATYVKNMRTWLTRAYDKFPRSSSITYGLGMLSQTVGDCKVAMRFYEDTIALKDRHEDSALQRVICLAYLGQSASAIEGATRIIDRGYYNLADAYYWRAWTHHRRVALPDARADIDRARAILVNAKVLTLGGMIKYDQKELDLAERDLTDALRMDPTQCVAHWYLGLVTFSKEAWPETAQRFGRAASCYESSADDSVRKRDAMVKADLDPDFKAVQIAGFDAVIKEDRDQQWASVLNAANAYARADQIPTALQWLARIPADAVLASKAAELRKLIGGKIPGSF
jgi:tetratricopeptide (TPR) repeat protein